MRGYQIAHGRKGHPLTKALRTHAAKARCQGVLPTCLPDAGAAGFISVCLFVWNFFF
jgi:hypothetical protein